MPPTSVLQMALPFAAASDEPDEWDNRLLDAFANEDVTSGFLTLAEEALRAMPGDAHILCLGATAALLDRNPERALVFLKRYSKRYVPTATHHLLSALALDLQNKPAMARAILERHGLTSPPDAMRAFPGGWARRVWLYGRLVNIVGTEAKGSGAAGGLACRSARPPGQQRRPLPGRRPKPHPKPHLRQRPHGGQPVRLLHLT